MLPLDPTALYAQALQGDLRALWPALLTLGRETSEEAGAWGALFSMLLDVASPIPGRVEAGQVALPQTPHARRILARLCAHEELISVARFERERLSGWVELHARLVEGLDDEVTALGLELGRAWEVLLRGSTDDLLRRCELVLAEAASRGDAALVLEATILRALALLSTGELRDALPVARRASRMARTEGLLHDEYVANIVLARARRMAGQPHLTMRIGRALAQVVPREFRGWIGWELLLAGDAVESGRDAAVGNASAAEQSLRAALAAAALSDRAAFDRNAVQARNFASAWRDAFEECDDVLVAVGDDDVRKGRAAAWLAGDSHEIPPSLRGLAIGKLDSAGLEHAEVFVVADRERVQRRLRPGLGLLPENARPTEQLNFQQNRSLTVLASLLFAGPGGLDDAELFQRVFGFAYMPVKHGNLLRTTLHRARKELPATARLERSEGRNHLIVTDPIAIPDPRCAPALDELILRTVALMEGRADAKRIAAAMGVPIRTVQVVLKDLVDQGCFESVRNGRQIEYRLEDTTFFEPTLERLAPRSIE